MHALVLGAQHGTFVGRHADAVGDHLDQDLVLFDFRQFKFHQAQVIGAMEAHGTAFHTGLLSVQAVSDFFYLNLLKQLIHHMLFGGLGAGGGHRRGADCQG